jgi:MSHA biogenesis protein MshK
VFNKAKGRLARSAALLLLGLGFCWPAFGQGPLSDPTRPPVGVVGSAGQSAPKTLKWKLTSTLISRQRRVAVINDQVVRVGQKIDGAVLVAVEPGSALLHHAGQKIQLKLVAGTVKQAVEPAP